MIDIMFLAGVSSEKLTASTGSDTEPGKYAHRKSV